MFDPSWDDGCPSCTAGADEIVRRPARAPARPRHDAGLRLARAAREDRATTRRSKGWTFPWYSSYGSDFNYDFHVTLDESVAPVEYNYRPAEHEQAGTPSRGRAADREPGTAASCATATTCSTRTRRYARGAEPTGGSYYFLDLTALGRQEDWEEPKGRADGRARRAARLLDRR